MGWIVIDYGKDQNSYYAYESREDAEKKFIEIVRALGLMFNDPEIFANDQDDMEELAAGGCYCHNGELQVEIARCDIYRAAEENV